MVDPVEPYKPKKEKLMFSIKWFAENLGFFPKIGTYNTPEGNFTNVIRINQSDIENLYKRGMLRHPKFHEPPMVAKLCR